MPCWLIADACDLSNLWDSSDLFWTKYKRLCIHVWGLCFSNVMFTHWVFNSLFRVWDKERLANVKIETLSKEKMEETEMTYSWSVHGWESGRPNKERINEMNLMHGYFLSCKIMHCITFAYCVKHMSSSHLKQKCRVLHPIKASERPSGRKKIVQIDQSFKRISLNSLQIQPISNQV